MWRWATILSTDHSDDACGVMTSCHTTFQPFLLRTDGDNNSHDLAIFQPSSKCGTKLPTILRVQLQNCQVRADMNLMAATASSQLRKYDCVPSEPRVTIWPCVSANINSFLVFCRAVIYHKATHRRPPLPRSDGSRDPSFGVGHWIATVDQCP